MNAILFGESFFYDMVSGLGPAQRFVLLLTVIGCVTTAVITLIAMVSGAVQTMQRTRVEAEMKRDMLDRGMSAEEIARVVEASTPKDFLDRWASNRGRRKSA